MKKKIYYTVGTVPKSNSKIVRRGKILIRPHSPPFRTQLSYGCSIRHTNLSTWSLASSGTRFSRLMYGSHEYNHRPAASDQHIFHIRLY